MHINHYFLKRLATELQYNLIGLQFLDCFSQTKNELILGFANAAEEFYIRAFLSPDLVCLSFANEFHKARQGADNYFREVMQTKVKGVTCTPNDRSISILLSNGYSLLFKLHGRNASVLLVNQQQKVEKLFPGQAQADMELDVQQLTKSNATGLNEFIELNGDLNKAFPAIGKELKAFLEAKLTGITAIEERFLQAQNLLAELQEKPIYIIRTEDGTPAVRFWPEGEVLLTTYDAIEAANLFTKIAMGFFAIYREKQNILNQLQRKLKQAQKFATNNAIILEELENGIQNDEIANIIMANLHVLKQGVTEATLLDFYRNQDITIKFKRDLSPQKNAENYYRKSKNQKIERQKLRLNISNKELLAVQTRVQIEEITVIENIKELRTYLKANGLEKADKHKDEEPLFKRYEVEGFEILIGRNSINNDMLTTKIAKKNDLWLHARNVSGSHVVIRQIPGKPFNKTVIEKAAQLAAYYSKGKTDSLCPVMYTPKKFVRKPKGAEPGQVVVEKEEVILVRPTNEV